MTDSNENVAKIIFYRPDGLLVSTVAAVTKFHDSRSRQDHD